MYTHRKLATALAFAGLIISGVASAWAVDFSTAPFVGLWRRDETILVALEEYRGPGKQSSEELLDRPIKIQAYSISTTTVLVPDVRIGSRFRVRSGSLSGYARLTKKVVGQFHCTELVLGVLEAETKGKDLNRAANLDVVCAVYAQTPSPMGTPHNVFHRPDSELLQTILSSPITRGFRGEIYEIVEQLVARERPKVESRPPAPNVFIQAQQALQDGWMARTSTASLHKSSLDYKVAEVPGRRGIAWEVVEVYARQGGEPVAEALLLRDPRARHWWLVEDMTGRLQMPEFTSAYWRQGLGAAWRIVGLLDVDGDGTAEIFMLWEGYEGEELALVKLGKGVWKTMACLAGGC